jgi:serine/threonine-protein kinase RsbW
VSLLSRTFDGDQVALLRRLVSKHATAAGLDESRRQDFVLAVDEIVTNAVRHGGGGGRVDVWLHQGQLWFRVSDTGPGLSAPPAKEAPPATRLGGRGLWIARQITDRLDITTGPGGTTIVGCIAVSQDAPSHAST